MWLSIFGGIFLGLAFQNVTYFCLHVELILNFSKIPHYAKRLKKKKKSPCKHSKKRKKKTVNGRIVCHAALGCQGNKAKHLWPRTYHNEQCTLWKNCTEDPWTSFVTANRAFSDVQWFIIQFGSVLVPLACVAACCVSLRNSF